MNRPLPFAALRAFDAAARHLSFKAAAAELGLTPTAISHQIKRLEGDADAKLFRRKGGLMSLTPAGQRFARDIAPALQNLKDAYRTLEGSRHKETVVVGAGPIFSSRWLAPRLSHFAATHPEIDLRLHCSPTKFWRHAHDFDIAIAWGDAKWPGVHSLPLLTLTETPVLSSDLAISMGPITKPRDLEYASLIHVRDETAWVRWFSSQGVSVNSNHGTVFQDANVALQAALYGHGVMLGYDEFIQDDLRASRLMQPLDDLTPASEAYHLIISESSASEAVQSVAEWLLTQASSG